MSYNNRSNFIKDFTNLKMLLLLGGISIFVLSFFLSLFISLRQYHSVAVIMDSLNDPDKLAMNKNERLSEFSIFPIQLRIFPMRTHTSAPNWMKRWQR